MKGKLLLLLLFTALQFSAFAQHEAEKKFFSTVPLLLKDYSPTGKPCEEAIEFIVDDKNQNTISLNAAGITRDAMGKAKVSLAEKGNKTVWYKISFKTDCELSFRIYADRAEDIYHYFIYQYDSLPDFCGRLKNKSITPIRASMLKHKEGIIGTGIAEGIKVNYQDTSELYLKRVLLNTPFLDGFRAKAGESYFIGIYHMEGADAIHYLVLNACYREINLKTENENGSAEKAQIIEKLPEHVTQPPSEKSQFEKDSLAAVERKNKAEKEKAEAATKKKETEDIKKKSVAKKIKPQLVLFDEKDTLNQYIIEGEITYSGGQKNPAAQAEIYISNADGSVTVVKKMYTNGKGMFRFVNLPSDYSYMLSLNVNDPNLIVADEPVLKGKLTLQGKPAGGVTINKAVKTDEEGNFTLTSKELFSIPVEQLFNRWSVDLSDPAAYAEMLKKYGGIPIEGLVYRLQIGAYRGGDNFDYSFMTEFGKVDRQASNDGITRFLIGEFSTLKEADVLKQKAIEKKIPDAFIIAYFNGAKKYLEELIEKNMFQAKNE